MSKNYKFFAVYYDSLSNGWACLPPLVGVSSDEKLYAKSLFDLPSNSVAATAVLESKCMFSFNKGLPEEGLSPEVIFRLSNSPVQWIDVEELVVDLWCDTHLLVAAEVSIDFVACFGDGKGRFPEAELLKYGMGTDDILALKSYSSAVHLIDDPIDQRFLYDDKKRRLVSWKKSLADIVGVEIFEKITIFSKHYGDKGARFVVGWG